MSHLAQSETVATSGAVGDTDSLKEMPALLARYGFEGIA